MADKSKGYKRSEKRFRLFQFEILVVFAILIVVVTVFIDFAIIKRTGRAMKEKVSELIAANSRQIELNINSYLERMETVPTLLFSDETYYMYDETDSGIEDYDKVKNEEAIRNRIVDIGLMENYADFGIVYADDHKVGWTSHGTQDLFSGDESMYDAFAACINNSKKEDGWCYGIKDNTDRIYYIKRLNPNAILISSIYTRELSSVFVYPEQLDEMTVRLVNEDNEIVFSSDASEIGNNLPDYILNSIENVISKGNMNSTIITDDYLINMNSCYNGWRVVCSVPTEIILKENDKLKAFTIFVSSIMALLFLLVGQLVIMRISKPVDGMVATLQNKAEIDRLSGVMNKATFQETVENELKKENSDRFGVFIMIDMDNFKQINDMLGHIYGDQVIIRMGKLLVKLHNDKTIIGRVGGDEFSLYTGCNDISVEDIKAAVSERMEMVMSAFADEYEYEREQCDLSVSAGVYICEVAETDFEEMYKKADSALYTSKKNGKACCTFFGKEDGDEA